MRVTVDDYTKASYKQFILDMEAANIEPWHYDGRMFYHGPAVTVKDIQDALSNTKVKCQWDSLGLSFVVYPR